MYVYVGPQLTCTQNHKCNIERMRERDRKRYKERYTERDREIQTKKKRDTFVILFYTLRSSKSSDWGDWPYLQALGWIERPCLTG